MPSDYFYISYTNPETRAAEVLYLDSTKQIDRTLPTTITDNPISTGDSVVDNVVNKGDVITFTGTITDIPSGEGSVNTDTFIDKITKLRDSKQLFDVISGDITTTSNSIRNCLFTSISFSQSSKNGVARGRVKSYKVTISFKQVRIAKLAQSGEVKVPGTEIEDAVQEKVTKPSSTIVKELDEGVAAGLRLQSL